MEGATVMAEGHNRQGNSGGRQRAGINGGRGGRGSTTEGRPMRGRGPRREADDRRAGGDTRRNDRGSSRAQVRGSEREVTRGGGRTANRNAGTSTGGHAFTPRSRQELRVNSPGKRNARSSAPQDETVSDTSNALIVGRHPVLEALKSGRSINKILIAETAEGGSLSEITGKAKAAGIVIQKVPRAHLDSITAVGAHHQGIVAYGAAHDYVELDEIIQRQTGHEPLVLLLDEVSDPYNLGAILRTAEATGVQGVVIPKRRAVPLTETVGKAAAGAMEYVPVARVANLVQAMETLKAQGYWIVGTDVDAPQAYTQITYRGPIAIVIGAEGKGLSRLVRERCDYTVSLPMLGELQSLNASVATGVLLYEVIRQRG